MNTFLVGCFVFTIGIFVLHNIRKNSSRHAIPDGVKLDNDMINSGIIPMRLGGVIPLEYQEREDYRMSSAIESIFVDAGTKPHWCLVVKLASRQVKTETIVVYDSDGEIYDY